MARGSSAYNRFVGARMRAGVPMTEAARQWRNQRGAGEIEDEVQSNPSGAGSLLKWGLLLGGAYLLFTMAKKPPAAPELAPRR